MKFFIVLAAVFFIAKADSCKKKDTCKGEAQKDCVCIQIYKPVCGCDGKTYGNDCVAKCEGVRTWTEGECPTK